MRALGSASTPRLRLEPWDHDVHAPGFAVVNAHPDVYEFLGGGEPMSRSESDAWSARIAAHWASYGFGLWAAVVKGTGAMIGFVGLCHPLWWPDMADRVEIGWRLARESWGRGYAIEGGREALRAGCETLGLGEILAFVHPANARSLAVCRRLGMAAEAELPHPSRDHLVKILRVACSTS